MPEGIVLDIPVQPRRDRKAAEASLRRLVEGQRYEPRVVITGRPPVPRPPRR